MNDVGTVVSTVPQPEDDERDPLFVSTEAASTNFYWTLGKHEVFNLQTTFRGNPQAVEIEAHLAAVKIALAQVVEIGGHAKPVGQQAAQPAPVKPAPAPAAKPGAPAPPTGTTPVKPSAAPVAQAGPKEILKLEFVKISVIPKTDGKCELQFFGAGHKFPDIYATRAVAKWAEELGWPDTAFVTTVYEQAGKVGYVLSDKVNSKGNRYKDIEYIKLT